MKWPKNLKRPQILTIGQDPTQTSQIAPIEGEIEIETIAGAVETTANQRRQIVIEAIGDLVPETGRARKAVELQAQNQTSMPPQVRITRANKACFSSSTTYSIGSPRHAPVLRL